MFLGQSKEDWVKAVGAAYGTLDPRGYESWQAGLRADQELQMRREREAQEGKIRGLELERAQRVNDASKTLNERYTVGMRDTAAIKAKDDDFEAADKAALAGQALPAFNQEVWAAPEFRKANQRELLDARRGLFAATGNAQGLQIADQEERGLNVQDRFKGLAQRVEQDPNAIVELSRRLNLDGNVPLTVETPMDPKTGRLTGIARINLVRANGDTKPIEVRGRQLQQLMLATSYIEEGAPEEVEKGLQLLAGIDQELAARVAASNKLNMDIAQLHNNAFGTQEEVRQGNARLDMQRQELDNARRGRTIQLFNPRTGQTGLFYEGELGRNKEGMVVLPQGWEFPRTPAEYRFVKDDSGGGFYTDRTGATVAKHDPVLGMVPFTPNPIESDPAVKQRAMKYGIQVVPWEADGRVIWAAVTPQGRRFDNVDEAIDSVVAAEAANTATGPRNEAAKRAAGMPAAGVFRPGVVDAARGLREGVSNAVTAVGRTVNPNLTQRPNAVVRP